MERVPIEEAQERLAELIARVVEGAVIVIEAGDGEQIQLARLPIKYLIEAYGIPTMLGGGDSIGDTEGVIRPYATTAEELERARAGRAPRQFGSAAGLISMSDDFDEPLELVPSRLVDKYPELQGWRDHEPGSGGL